MQLVVGKLVKVDDIQFVTNIDKFLVHRMYEEHIMTKREQLPY